MNVFSLFIVQVCIIVYVCTTCVGMSLERTDRYSYLLLTLIVLYRIHLQNKYRDLHHTSQFIYVLHPSTRHFYMFIIVIFLGA